MAATRGELFAGVTVAIVTPFKNGEVDCDDLGKLVDWHVEQGTDAWPRAAPPASRRRSTTTSTSSVIAVRLRAGPRPHQGHGRHRLEQHRARPSA